jgi:MFS family permease
VTAYTLTSTAFIPAFGQIADIFGRHVAIQLSMCFMLIGSVLCAAAQSWVMLLFGRALQGVSAAGLMNMVKIVMADNVPLAEQSKNSSLFALVNGISYSVGPVIGGSLAAKNWRYCFVISIPMALLGQILIFFLLRKELVRGSHHLTGPERKSLSSGLSTIDYGGTLLFIFGTGLIILGTSWGGSKYPWASYRVLVPLVVGSVLFVLFFCYEYILEPGRMLSRRFPNQVAMIPFKLFERKDVIILAIVNAATGAALYSAFYFVGIFWTLVQNYSPVKAGYQLLYYTPGLGCKFRPYAINTAVAKFTNSGSLWRHFHVQCLPATNILSPPVWFHTRRGRIWRLGMGDIDAQVYSGQRYDGHIRWRNRLALYASHPSCRWCMAEQPCSRLLTHGF